MSYVVEDELYQEFCKVPAVLLPAEEEEVVVDELVVILRECLEKVKTKSRELLLRKFFSELHKEIPIERFIIHRLQQSQKNNSRVSAISELMQKDPVDLDIIEAQTTSVPQDIMFRGLHEPVEELPGKLERFKVKTIAISTIGGVDKVELPTQARY